MHGTSDGNDRARIAQLELRLRRTQVSVAMLALAAVLLAGLASFGARDRGEPLRVRGLIIEDEAGKARVLIGAPVPQVAERTRKDAATGMVVLGEGGVDRLQIGLTGGPQMGGKLQSRIAAACGLMVCDLAGDERGGFGFLANGQVGWGLDWNGQEGIVAAVIPDQGMAGILINTQTQSGDPTRMSLISNKQGTSLRLADGKGTERAVLEVGGLGAPTFKVLDDQGAVVRDVIAPP